MTDEQTRRLEFILREWEWDNDYTIEQFAEDARAILAAREPEPLTDEQIDAIFGKYPWALDRGDEPRQIARAILAAREPEPLTDEQIDEQAVAGLMLEPASRTTWYVDGASLNKSDLRGFVRNCIAAAVSPEAPETNLHIPLRWKFEDEGGGLANELEGAGEEPQPVAWIDPRELAMLREYSYVEEATLYGQSGPPPNEGHVPLYAAEAPREPQPIAWISPDELAALEAKLSATVYCADDRCDGDLPLYAAQAPREPQPAPDPNCRYCRGTGVDGDVAADGSVMTLDCVCVFKAPKEGTEP